MKSTLFLIICLFFVCYTSQGQVVKEERDSSRVLDALDSLFIDHDIKNYSLRLFSNYKIKRFRIKNGNSKLSYVPNNRYGLGFGFANSKLLFDIAFNVKSGKEEVTKRFDFQGTFLFGKHHYVNGFVQSYKGFNVNNNFNQPNEFRDDIRSTTIGFNYLYTLSEVEFSYSLLKTGQAVQNKKVFITGGIGVFGVLDYFSSEGSILPINGELFLNEQAEIKRYDSVAIGVLTGFLSVFVLPKNFLFSCNIMPGLALMNKKVALQEERYRPSNPLLYKLDFNAALSYNAKRYYISLVYGTEMHSTNLDFDNRYRFNLSKAKLAFGYKLGVNKKRKK